MAENEYLDIIIFLVITLYVFKRIYDLLSDNKTNSVKTEAGDESYEGPFAKELRLINSFDKTFNPELFLLNSQKSFEIILRAYYNFDLENVKRLAASNISSILEKNIKEMRSSKQIASFELIRFLKTQLVDLKVEKKKVTAEVHFETEQITNIKDNKGKIVVGSDERIQTIKDTWIFEKDYADAKSIFKLVETLEN